MFDDKAEITREVDAGFCQIKMSLKYNLSPVRQHVKDYAEATIMNFALEVAQNAKDNVAPNVGPGPHPHTWIDPSTGKVREDTGNLMRSITITQDPEWRGSRMSVVVGATGEPALYGDKLEFGFTGPSGAMFIYPWLEPAYQDALSSLSRWYQGKIQTKMSGKGQHSPFLRQSKKGVTAKKMKTRAAYRPRKRGKFRSAPKRPEGK